VRYFRDYLGGLPYHDTSIGQQIAAYADALPAGTHVYVAGCCWQDQMPSAEFVKLVAARPPQIHEVPQQSLTCDALDRLSSPAVLVWSFHEAWPNPELAQCPGRLSPVLERAPNGLPVFHTSPVRPGPTAH
jgi:hypothetical protein